MLRNSHNATIRLDGTAAFAEIQAIFGGTLGTKAGFGQECLAMRLLAGYSGYANPPIGGSLIILSRCTDHDCKANSCQDVHLLHGTKAAFTGRVALKQQLMKLCS